MFNVFFIAFYAEIYLGGLSVDGFIFVVVYIGRIFMIARYSGEKGKYSKTIIINEVAFVNKFLSQVLLVFRIGRYYFVVLILKQ